MDKFPESVSDLAKRADAQRLPDSTGAPHRRVGLVQERLDVGAVVGTGDDAGRNRDPQPPRPLQLLQRPQQPLRHLHSFDRPQVRGEDADRVLLEAKGFVDDADAVAQGGTEDRQHRLLGATGAAVAGPRAGGVEDGERERVPVAAVGLRHLVEPAAHVAGPVEAGELVLLGGLRPRSAGAGSGAGWAPACP